jgi:hypothetical protein
MERYKKKGYTYIKREGTVFKFIKGPYIHLVELMSLGNGLLYLNNSSARSKGNSKRIIIKLIASIKRIL